MRGFTWAPARDVNEQRPVSLLWADFKSSYSLFALIIFLIQILPALSSCPNEMPYAGLCFNIMGLIYLSKEVSILLSEWYVCTYVVLFLLWLGCKMVTGVIRMTPRHSEYIIHYRQLSKNNVTHVVLVAFEYFLNLLCTVW